MKSINSILLVEDNRGDARLLQEMFKERDTVHCTLNHVESMMAAEQHLAEHAVDLILLDLGLPDADGLGAIRRIRAAAPSIPLVVLTGLDDDELAVQALHEGAQDFLIKGQIDTRGLLRAMRYANERKRLESLKSEFVSSVSHELRTPLTSISASLGLLVGKTAGELPAPAAHLIGIAHSNSLRLVGLVNDILDIEKLDAGKTVFNYERVDVRRPIELAIKANLGSAEAAGVRIICDIHAGAVVEVRADPERLAQALTNLLSNAVKFSPRDAEVEVTVTSKSNEIRISVRDHGAGIPDDFKPRIFERFAQADGTDTRLRGGTGLGLSIVKQIVDRLGGKVGFGDAPGGGALFYIDMPCWVADGDVATETEAQLEALKQIHREFARDEPDLPRQPPRTEPAVSKRA